ncbi:MAG: GNAT family N-acetyltransferase [Eubacteriales bacterium]|nr:GNAT family N-acetyltransferase [Eubacteriales bacterium]
MEKDDIIFTQAQMSDIPELVRLRIAYMRSDYGSLSDLEEREMCRTLPDYFERKLGQELLAFVAKTGNTIVSTAFLLIVEKPANPHFLNGKVGEVLNVYTEESYRHRGISTRLMKDLIKAAGERGLNRIDLSATKDGYPLYKKLGFEEKGQTYTDMRYTL